MPIRIGLIVQIIAMLAAVHIVAASPIAGAEYFFDNDPGYGLGTSIAMQQGDSIQCSFRTTTTAPGFHMLYIRARDTLGIWGPPTRLQIWSEAIDSLPANIRSLEYFFDTDPGIGSGIHIGDFSTISVNSSLIADCSTLSLGFHSLYVRTIDGVGKPSFPIKRPIWVESSQLTPSNITAAEYFFDNDPGRGGGTAIPLTSNSQVQLNFIADLSTLSPGIHTLFSRVKDSYNNWGFPIGKTFWVEAQASTNPNITAAEYFMDSDPGRGNGTAVSVVPGQSIVTSFRVNLTQFNSGFHILFIRVRDSVKWGPPVGHGVWVERLSATAVPIVSGEYFIDTDPGYNHGTPLSVSESDSVTIAFNVDFSTITAGYHNLFIRTRDAQGRWSMPLSHRLLISSPPGVPQALLIQYQNQNAYLNWTLVDDSEIQEYRIYRDTTGYFSPPEQGTLVGSVNATTNTFIDSNVSDRYFYRVTAFKP